MEKEEKSWMCSVCGYVHYGAEPPESCPICGATKELFELIEETTSTTNDKQSVSQWRCLNCEYIHDGSVSPESCPVCGAVAERFEPYVAEQNEVAPTSNQGMRIVIAGAGVAGVSAAEAVRKAGSDSEIVLLSKENHLPYYRLNLTRYLAGEISEESLPLHPEAWYQERRIQLQCEKEICSIDVAEKHVVLRGDEKLDYDRLIVTIGSHPFIPPFPGAGRKNVMTLRTKDDADRILKQCESEIRVVVIGGGLLGLEAAGALARRGVSVTLLEGHGWLLPRQLNQKAGAMLEQFAESCGIALVKNARTKEIVGDECVRGVMLEDGRVLSADLVVITTGVRSNSYIARMAGLDVNNGIVVSNHMQSSQPEIYAAGDVAEHQGVSYGTWGPSQFQGTIAGNNAAGVQNEFAGIPRSNMLKVLGYDMFSIGQLAGEDASYRIIEATQNAAYFYFLFRDNHLVGSILLGDTALSAQVKQLIEKKIDCAQLLSTSPDAASVIVFLQEL